MSDDFGTINVRRGERAREIEILRQHYRHHRETLAQLIADAPTEHLASEYQRVIGSIDNSLVKLDELEGLGAPAAAPAPPPPPPQQRMPESQRLPEQRTTEPGLRPLAKAPGMHQDELSDAPTIPPSRGEVVPKGRLLMIVGAALLLLLALGWLIWWASSDRAADSGTGTIVEEPSTAPLSTAGDTVDETPAPAAPASSGLVATPPSHDYGTVAKGTRAVRVYSIANNTDEPVTLVVARSACRCLYYSDAVIPPRSKENLTVTIDGARAKAGALREAIRVSAKSDTSVGTTIDVIATVR